MSLNYGTAAIRFSSTFTENEQPHQRVLSLVLNYDMILEILCREAVKIFHKKFYHLSEFPIFDCLILNFTKGYSSKVYHPGGDGILKKF